MRMGTSEERKNERRILNPLEENLEDIRRFFQKGREWLQKSHAEGLSGGELGQNYSALMDRVLRRLLALEEKASAGRRGADRGFSLLATGGAFFGALPVPFLGWSWACLVTGGRWGWILCCKNCQANRMATQITTVSSTFLELPIN